MAQNNGFGKILPEWDIPGEAKPVRAGSGKILPPDVGSVRKVIVAERAAEGAAAYAGTVALIG